MWFASTGPFTGFGRVNEGVSGGGGGNVSAVPTQEKSKTVAEKKEPDQRRILHNLRERDPGP